MAYRGYKSTYEVPMTLQVGIRFRSGCVTKISGVLSSFMAYNPTCQILGFRVQGFRV